jgi:hypothetical protein
MSRKPPTSATRLLTVGFAGSVELVCDAVKFNVKVCNVEPA